MKSDRNKVVGVITKPRVIQTDPVEVFCRVRPVANSNDAVCLRVQSEKLLQLLPPEIYQKYKDCVVSEFTFRHVFSEKDSQSDVFVRVALPLVQDVINGKNGLLFTYGVTSSGKTYTMTGTAEDCGILPRSLDAIFNSLKTQQTAKFVIKPNKQNGFKIQPTADALTEQQKELNQKSTMLRKRNLFEWSQRSVETRSVELSRLDCLYTVFVSFVEIYNNYIYDLLEENAFDLARGKPPQSKILREDRKKNMFVSDTTELEVKSAEEAFEVFLLGQQRRKIAHTALNTESSRSHSVFVIKVVQVLKSSCNVEIDMSASPLASQLSLVDLAGSERTGRTGNAGLRLKEAGNINNSLMVLRQCIEVLREKQNTGSSSNKIVPYRDNKLTHLFKSNFEGEGQVRMIICANPGIYEFEETVQAMKFAEMAQDVLIPRQVQRPPPVPPKVVRIERTDSSNVLTLGPAFPDIVMSGADDTQPLKTLEEFLLMRISCKTQALQAYAEKQADFREQLVKFQAEYNNMKQQVRTLQVDLAQRVQQLSNLEKKWSGAELNVSSLQKKVSELERTKRLLLSQLREKDNRINASKVNHLKMKADLKDQLDIERDRMSRMMEHRLAAKEAELQAKMCLSEEKLSMLKEILKSGDDWALTDGVLDKRGITAISESNLYRLAVYKPGTNITPTKNALSQSDPKVVESIKTQSNFGVSPATPRRRRSISAGCDSVA